MTQNSRLLLNIILLIVIAILVVNQLVILFPSNRAWINLAKAALSRNPDFEKPITMFKSESEYSYRAESISLGLGTAYLLDGNAALAIRSFQQNTRLNVLSVRSYIGLAQAYLLTEQTDLAAQSFQQAGILSESIILAGDRLVSAGEWERALAFYSIAGYIDGTLPPATKLIVGITQLKMGRVSSAEANFQAVLISKDADAKTLSEAHYQLGSLHFWNNPELAWQHLVDATSLDPQNVNAFLAVGDFAYLQKHDLVSMADAYSHVIEMWPDQMANWLSISIAQGSHANDPRWNWLGRARELAGQPCLAIEAYKHALIEEVDPIRLSALISKCQ